MPATALTSQSDALHLVPGKLAPRAMANIAATDLGNPVTAVLMAYRAIDTLLETVVLLLALLGMWSLAPDRLWGGSPVSLIMPIGTGCLPSPRNSWYR